MTQELKWRAVYHDGRVLRQEGETGEVHKYSDIERDKLICFDLWRDGQLLVRVDMRDDGGARDVGPKRLIWRIRTELDSTGKKTRVHLVGWQRLVKGSNVQAICYVFESGGIILGGQFNEADPLMYPVATLACEAAE